MPNLGLVCPPYTGHLNPMTTLGRELRRRGHNVTLFAVPDAEEKTRNAGLNFVPLGATLFPKGSTARFTEKQAVLRGLPAVKYVAAHILQNEEMLLDEFPTALAQCELDGLLLDQTAPGAAAVADKLAIPYVTICNAMALNSEPDVPPFMLPWAYATTPLARLRNKVGHKILDHLARPVITSINAKRRVWNLPLLTSLNDGSALAQIAQQPAFFDFPRRQLPACFHYTGPFHDDRSGGAIDFPWERLNGKPLIYASMGTLQNRLHHVFRTIAEACIGLDAQLVISLGSKDQTVPTDFPGNPIVVQYAPQLELLKIARLVITHAGMNTTLESLAQGIPMVAIPVTSDQPGVAARLVYLGVGEMVTLDKLTTPRLRKAIATVWNNDTYRQKAALLQQEIEACDGVRRAADIAEAALSLQKSPLSRV